MVDILLESIEGVFFTFLLSEKVLLYELRKTSREARLPVNSLDGFRQILRKFSGINEGKPIPNEFTLSFR